jgi:MFS family permease
MASGGRKELAAAMSAVFANRSLRRLQLAWAGAITTDGAQNIALAVYAYQAAGVGGVGVLGLVRSIPAAVVGPLTGGIVDRFRARVPGVVLAIRAVLFAVMAVALALDAPLALTFGLAAVETAVYSLYWPAQAALLPALASTPHELTAANVTATIIENGGALAGPVLAGVALAFAGASAVFTGCAVVGGLSAVAVVRLRAGSPHRDAQRPTDILAGYRTLTHERDPRSIISLYLAQTFCLGALNVLVVVVALRVLQAGQDAVGFLTGAVGVGGLLGSTVAIALVGRRRLAVPFGLALLLWGGALATVAGAPGRISAVLLLSAVGAANALGDVTALTLLQRVVRERVLGRVLSIVEGLWWAMLGFGGAVAALLIGAVGARTALLVTGGSLALLAVTRTAALRGIDDRAAVPVRQIRALEKVPMFAGQSPLAIERLAFDLVSVTAGPGEVIMRAGEPGDRFYMIDAGTVRVTRAITVTLGPGDHFGELALLNDAPRNATVEALDDVRLFALDRADFLSAITRRSSGRDGAAIMAAR